ncbi:N-acetylneuraminate synthase [Pseudoalteromonas pernae]|uniref:N-acetylneuraminate synthase n=1 Tax=Pseudoalteromonas pernae TaxID=3118054 RepID=UPI0032424B5C
MTNRTLIIAEAGVNHNGDIELAKKLVDAAVGAGADIVKFQTFKASNLASIHAVQAKYQARNLGTSESQLAMLKRLELPYESHDELIRYCDAKKIGFLSTAFDEQSLDFLKTKLQVSMLKIPSGEITNGPLLLAHARCNKHIILSTGMANLGEIEEALGVLAFGMTNNRDTPSKEAFELALASKEGQAVLRDKVTLLHCTTEYPAPLEDINLNAMATMEQAFGLQVGYSDHSKGIIVPIAAVAKGARVIEKHFTLSRNMEGPDHKASLEPDELLEMVQAIRNIESALGCGRKCAMPSEVKNKAVARKSLVASKDIAIGDKYSAINLTAKRPGNGISPMLYWELLGQAATNEYQMDEQIK